MSVNFITLLVFLAPAAFIITAIASWFQAGARPALVKQMSFASTIIGILIAAISGVLVYYNGLLETSFLGFQEIGISLRLDAISVSMFGMIALLGFIVVKFSSNYLDGDKRQGAFVGRLAATIASVQLLVLSGNLGVLLVAWILTSISLHRLLVFYPERPGAVIAARKKFIVARLGDASLFAAIIVLYNQFGTGNLESIFQAIKINTAAGLPLAGIESAAILIALAAILKSAQFPTHGWLIEVMETPTPVSALLHAGLLNAGPFLIVRMAFIMEASSYASLILLGIGGFTALFASVVFLTQTSVKTALGYSSIAHMGFSLMVCGLGAYPAAMLHLVAHSFYKAHAFLASGSVIDMVRAAKVAQPTRIGSPLRIALGIVLALGVYIGFAMIWGLNPSQELSLVFIGSIIVLGISRIFAAAIDSDAKFAMIGRASFFAILVAASFFALEAGMHYLLTSQVPSLIQPSGMELIFMGVLLFAFTTVIVLQIIAPVLSSSAAYQSLAIHVRNGLYVNAIFDRWVSSLRIHSEESAIIMINDNAERLEASTAKEILQEETV